MDISSIFSNKRMPFNQNKTNKSRFFNDPGSESEEEKDGNSSYAQNQKNNESSYENSIFSSGDMFNNRGTNSNVAHQAPMNKANLQPVFNMFGQSTRLPEHYQQQINPRLYDELTESQSEYETEQKNFIFSPAQMDQIHDQQEENPGPGLGSNSFANLRKRALDAGTSYESAPQQHLQSSHQTTTSPNNYMKPQLGDLPVPKFLLEQR